MTARSATLLASVATVALGGLASPAWAVNADVDVAQVQPSASTNASPSTAPAAAEASAATPNQLGEVVVTARKVTENVQKAPASIVAVSGAELQRQGITSAQSLEKVIPSGNFRQEGPVVQTFIRGVGTNLDSPYVDVAVAYNYNGIVIPRFATGGLIFDLSSVQVIAGPQGTLYGGTAAGGAVNVSSALPRNDFSGNALIEGGDYGRGHVAVDQNMPAGDRVSLRVAVDYDRRDGYESRNFDALDTIKGRLSLLAKPTDDLTALVFFSGFHDTSQPATTVNFPLINPSNPWTLAANGPVYGNPISASVASRNEQTFVVGANIEYRLGDNVFTYIPGFVRNQVLNDTYVSYLPHPIRIDDNQHTEELRWNRTVGAFKLSAGLFYRFDLQNSFNKIGAPVLPVAPFISLVNINSIPKQVDTNYAGYVQGVYSFTDKLRFTVGGRFSEDHKQAVGNGVVGRTYPRFTVDETHQHIDWKVGVDYDLAPRVLVYANAQTGYLPIGFAPFPGTAVKSNYVPEERLLSFSGGFKSRFLNGRVELNNEFYYYDYLNFQVVNFTPANGITSIYTARRSTIYGDETTLRALLPYSSELDVGFNLMSAKYNEFTTATANYSGLQMVDAPTANINAGLQHTLDLSNLGQLRGRIQTHYESGHWGEFDHLTDTHQSSYTKTDLTATFIPRRGSWSAEVYVNNVENQYVFGALNSGGQPGPASGFLEPPRTFGARVYVSWE